MELSPKERFFPEILGDGVNNHLFISDSQQILAAETGNKWCKKGTFIKRLPHREKNDLPNYFAFTCFLGIKQRSLESKRSLSIQEEG